MELVYLDGKKEPYTTSEIIAECAGVQHHTVTRLIRNHIDELLTLGELSFDRVKQKGKTGQFKKLYRLNEGQFLFIVSLQRNLKRNQQVIGEFKKQFAMEYQNLKIKNIAGA